MHLLKSNGLQFKQITNILDGSTRVFIIPANSLNLFGNLSVKNYVLTFFPKRKISFLSVLSSISVTLW